MPAAPGRRRPDPGACGGRGKGGGDDRWRRRGLLFVVLKPGHEPSDDVELSIMNTIRKRLSPLAMPQAIEFVDSLPRTRSGKIMRRLLKAREWGEPIGDISTLEND